MRAGKNIRGSHVAASALENDLSTRKQPKLCATTLTKVLAAILQAIWTSTKPRASAAGAVGDPRFVLVVALNPKP